jgi:hypothetical protein
VKTNSWGKRARTDVAATLAVPAIGLGVTLGIGLGVGLGVGCAKADGPAAATAPGSFRFAVHGPVDFAFDSLDDRPVTAEAARGKPTIVAFVTTSSLPAQAQVDFLVAMAKHDADRINYAVVALEQRDNRELVELYRKALSIPFPVALADAETFAGSGPFGDVRAVPVTLMLDRTGRVVFRVDGRVAKSSELRAALRGL